MFKRSGIIMALFGAFLAGHLLLGTDAPTVFNSGDTSELITEIQVDPTGSVVKHTLYCIDLGTAPAAGSRLSFEGTTEVTNDLSYSPDLGGQLLLASSCSTSTGTEISEGSGFNCTPGQRHCVLDRFGDISVPANNTKRFIEFVIWAGTGSGSWTDLDALTVEQDYGRLSGLVWFA